MRITYRGAPRGVRLFAADLREEGLAVEYPPPEPAGSTGQPEISVVMSVREEGTSVIRPTVGTAAVLRARARFARQMPRAKVEIEPDDAR